MPERTGLDRLTQPYPQLSLEQRDEVLQPFFIAASRGGEAMVDVPGQAFPCRAPEEACQKDKIFNSPQVQDGRF